MYKSVIAVTGIVTAPNDPRGSVVPPEVLGQAPSLALWSACDRK